MMGMMIYSIFSLCDTFFVARLGAPALAALSFCIPVQVLLVSIGSATGVGLTSLIARTLGSGERARADNAAWHGVLISFVYGGLFLAFGFRFMDDLLLLFGCTPETFALARGYLQIILAGCVFAFVPVTLGNIVQGEGNTTIPVLVSLAAIVLNVLFDPFFIFGLGPVKAMGLNGAALASVLAQVLSSILLVVIVMRRRAYLSWSWEHFNPSISVVAGIYKVGLPTMVMEIAGVLVMIYINRILAGYSYTAVAALGIFLRIRSLVFMPVLGLLQGTMPIASFAYGARQYDRVKEVLIKASATATLIMAGGWIIMQCYPLWIMNFFSSDPGLTYVGVTCLRLATIFLPLIGPVLILSTVLQALGKGMTAMWLSLARQLGFFLPLLFFLPPLLQLNGVWLTFSIAELLSALLGCVFLIYLWRQLQTPKNRQPVIMMFNRGYFFKRLLAWMRWQ